MFLINAEWWATAGVIGALAITTARAVAAAVQGQADSGLWVVAVLLVVALVALFRAVRNRRHELAAGQVRSWRQSRHALFNHLQVIGGWLQLDRPERARAYIESLTARSAEYRQLFDRMGDQLAVDLMRLVDAAEAAGIGLRLSGSDARAELPGTYVLPALAAVLQHCRITGERPAELVVEFASGSVRIGLCGIDVGLAADAVRRAVGDQVGVTVAGEVIIVGGKQSVGIH